MITGASFRNFKSLRHVDVDFERMTVFVGPNASGKTSILEGLYYLSRLASISVERFLKECQDFESIRSRSRTDEEMKFECFKADAAFRLRSTPPPKPLQESRQLEILPSTTDLQTRWTTQAECGTPKDGGYEWRTSFQARDRDPVASLFRSAKILRLDARVLAEPSYGDPATTDLGSDGSGKGLASLLAFMALNQPDGFQLLQERLRSVIPAVKRIRFNRVPVIRIETEVVTIDSDRLTRQIKRDYIGDEIVLDLDGAPDIPAHLASEGTLLVLGILTVLLNSRHPNLVLVDDLDRGLHPKAQRRVVQLLRRVMEENQDLQIIATTHSPYIVDELDPKEVRVTWAGEDGGARCGRLDSHPEFERWKDEMWPGEFWSLVGEQWIANGQGPEKP